MTMSYKVNSLKNCILRDLIKKLEKNPNYLTFSLGYSTNSINPNSKKKHNFLALTFSYKIK